MKKLNFNHGGGATNRLAFTLAEVLITLAIIGVVAALTIPSVIANHKKNEIETTLKSTYNLIANATNMAIKDNGTINTWTFEKNDNETYEEGFIRKYWAPYIKIIKNCGSSPENDCAYDVLALNGKPFTFFAIDANSDFSRIYLANGAAISVYISRNNTTGEPASANFLIDTNGWKKPNKVGIDIFPFMYNPNSTNEKRKFMFGFPSYGDARLNITDAYGGCDKTLENRRTGIYCLSLIYKNGWKIPTVDEYVKTAGGDESYRAKYPWNF